MQHGADNYIRSFISCLKSGGRSALDLIVCLILVSPPSLINTAHLSGGWLGPSSHRFLSVFLLSFVDQIAGLGAPSHPPPTPASSLVCLYDLDFLLCLSPSFKFRFSVLYLMQMLV